MRLPLPLLARTILFAVATLVTAGSTCAQETTEGVPDWIWAPQHRAGHVPQASCYFRKTVQLSGVKQATLAVAADDHFELFVNGRRIGQATATQGVRTFDVTRRIRKGDNTIAIKVENRDGSTAGLAARVTIVNRHNKTTVFVTDASWKTSLSPTLLWTRTAYFDNRWKPAHRLGPFHSFLANQQATLQRDATADAEVTGPTEARRSNAEESLNATAPSVTAGHPVHPDHPARPARKRQITRHPASGDNLEVPREFELQHLAGHSDIGSATAITFDANGNLIVAREDGQLWLMVKHKNQWKAIRDYGHVLKTCQGLLAISGQLYATGLGDEGLGLYRLSDGNNDGRLDLAKLIVAFHGDNLEHGPHGVVLGPDGMLYVIVGNHSPLKTKVAESSPYRYEYEGDLLHPRFEDPGGHATGVKAPGGYILRTDPEGKQVEIFAGGLRNAYDLAFDRNGNLFTHDSDMESDRGTTWYRPTRVYHVIDGAEFGWRSGWSKWPDYYLDSLPGIADTGRGSPTGMVVYNHRAFPDAYQNAIFSCDWSEGRIWVFSHQEKGAGREAKAKVFVQGTPLNVTDIEVGPDGALYFATGGRATAGNIYRVAWRGGQDSDADIQRTGIESALRQVQPSSAWARRRIASVKQQVGHPWATRLEQAARDTTRPSGQRVQALQIMQWFGPSPSVELLTDLTREQDRSVRRRATFLLGLHSEASAQQRLIQLLVDQDAVVRRRACEGLASSSHPADLTTLSTLLTSSDRSEAWAARRVLETTPKSLWEERILTEDNQRQFLIGATALILVSPDVTTGHAILKRSAKVMQEFLTDDDFIDLLRLQQLVLARTNLKPSDVPELRKSLAEEYPSSSATINRELVRLLAYLQVDWITDRYVKELDRDWPDAEQLHLAMHLAFLKSGWNTSQKMTVLQHLASPVGEGNSVPGYLQRAALHLGRELTTDELSFALNSGHDNPGAAMVALLRLPSTLSSAQIDLIKHLDEQTEGQDGETVRRLRIAMVAVLARDGSDAATRYLREIYDRDPTRRVEVALGLSEAVNADNFPYLVRSLSVLSPNDAKEMLTKLREVREWPETSDAYRQVILAAQRLGDQGASEAIKLLEHWQGYAPNDDSVTWETAIEAWKRWFKQRYPDQSIEVPIASITNGKWDEQALLQHLGRAEHEHLGSVENGKTMFATARCASCHQFGGEGESMGPDLTGIGKRFLTREILDSMTHPSKVISDQYAGKIVSTRSGKVYSGIVAQGADDEVMILQANGQKIRLPQADVEQIEPSGVSAMPEGLLDVLTLEEITDLFAYLTSSNARVTRITLPTNRK